MRPTRPPSNNLNRRADDDTRTSDDRRHQIVVNAPIARAFSAFTEDFGSFKPPERNLLSVEIAETVLDRHLDNMD